MEFKDQDIIEFFERVVDTLRVENSYTGVFLNNETICNSIHNLSNDDIISIDNVEYKVYGVEETLFKVKGNVTAFNEYKTLAPYFLPGNMREIAETLTDIDNSGGVVKYKKYPLIILKLDTDEERQDNTGAVKFPNLNLFIVNGTNPNYRVSDRRIRNFKPVLIPLYENLFKVLKRSLDVIQNVDNFKHAKANRYFWGSSLNAANTENVLNDFLDAVEIKNLNLNIKIKKCYGITSNM